jgi:DNA-binding transcriptional ArsR family regulator
VLQIDMDSAALANTRFAISPLHATVDALWLLRNDVPLGGAGWGALVRDTVRDRGLTLLGSLFAGTWDYVPDFLAPQPGVPEGIVEDELHAMATVDPRRLRFEIEIMTRGNAPERLNGRPAARVLKDALEQGETALAEALAAELHQVWHRVISPHWDTLRARLEADIDWRARTAARHGLSAVLTGLHPRVVWDDDRIRLMTRFQGRIPGTTHPVLIPSAFSADLRMTLDSVPGPVHRQPMLAYPARRGPEAGPAAEPSAHALLGVTRARLLSDLRCPRTTAELGERHFLAASTVSYHLGILHRSGLVTRTRTRQRVLYQQTSRATSILVG